MAKSARRRRVPARGSGQSHRGPARHFPRVVSRGCSAPASQRARSRRSHAPTWRPEIKQRRLARDVTCHPARPERHLPGAAGNGHSRLVADMRQRRCPAGRSILGGSSARQSTSVSRTSQTPQPDPLPSSP